MNKHRLVFQQAVEGRFQTGTNVQRFDVISFDSILVVPSFKTYVEALDSNGGRFRKSFRHNRGPCSVHDRKK